jgi:membrane protease YdiL (CAAX protease family)
LQVFSLWLLGYLSIGQLLLPFILALLGVERWELSQRSNALLHLSLDFVQLLVTILILWRCLKKYRPLANGFFKLAMDRGKWVLWVLLGAASFPFIDWASHQSLSLLFGSGAAEELWSSGEVVAGLSDGDWVTQLSFYMVVSLCAPLWEELVFRGFLLASLTRFLSPWWAVVVTALVFALCHFRLETVVPLLLLGLVLGGVYMRTNNLLPPILVHSLWNLYVVWTIATPRTFGWPWWPA